MLAYAVFCVRVVAILLNRLDFFEPTFIVIPILQKGD